MCHGRHGGSAATRGNYRHSLLALLISFLPGTWSPVTARRGCWCEWSLALVALAMNLSSHSCASQRFREARLLLAVAGPRLPLCGRTYQGFIKALMLHGHRLVQTFAECLRARMLSMPSDRQLIHGWNAFAVDGSHFDAPRTTSNLRKLKCLGTRGDNQTHPQLTLTSLYHMGTGVLFSWMVGTARASERSMLRRLVHGLPPGSLIVADAGFFGFDLLSGIVAGGRSFLIRGCGSFQLIKEPGRRTGYLYWPRDLRTHRPLRVRLIRVGGIELVTNVLSSSQLSKATAHEFYRMRWGIEVMFRTLKQTLERRTVCSRNGRKAMMELEWIAVTFQLMSLCMAELCTDPRQKRLSAAGVLAELRCHLHPASRRTPVALTHRLKRCVMDSYARPSKKASKNWPRKKTCKPAKRVAIRAIERYELALLRAFDQKTVS